MRTEPRTLSDAEAAVLDLVLSEDFEGVAELRDQAGTATVVGRCDCGCPSVDLAVGTEGPRSPFAGTVLPAEGRIEPVGVEPPGEVLVFAMDGWLSYLEYVFYGDTPPSGWPLVERISTVLIPR